MGVKKIDDLIAFQLAVEFKRGVYRLVQGNGQASADYRYRQQLCDAAGSVEANVVEGWHRYKAGEFCQFLRYALASVAEAKRWVQDGVDRGYFDASDCNAVLTLGNRCAAALMNLHKSLRPFIQSGRKP